MKWISIVFPTRCDTPLLLITASSVFLGNYPLGVPRLCGPRECHPTFEGWVQIQACPMGTEFPVHSDSFRSGKMNL